MEKKARRQPTCPICRNPVELLKKNPTFPFCGPRCQQIDLGTWLGEGYSIKGRTRDLDPADLSEEELEALLQGASS